MRVYVYKGECIFESVIMLMLQSQSQTFEEQSG